MPALERRPKPQAVIFSEVIHKGPHIPAGYIALCTAFV